MIKCIQKIQHRRDRVLQGSVKSQNLACHFLTDGLRIVVDVDVEIIPEQFDHWQVCVACEYAADLDSRTRHSTVFCE